MEAWKHHGHVCQSCRTELILVGGKVEGAEYDHKRPLSWIGNCPMRAARTKAARLKLVQEGEVMQLLCKGCHQKKSAGDRKLAASAARATLYVLLCPLRPGSPWTVEELMLQYSPKALQKRLKACFHQDLLDAGESLSKTRCPTTDQLSRGTRG